MQQEQEEEDQPATLSSFISTATSIMMDYTNPYHQNNDNDNDDDDDDDYTDDMIGDISTIEGGTTTDIDDDDTDLKSELVTNGSGRNDSSSLQSWMCYTDEEYDVVYDEESGEIIAPSPSSLGVTAAASSPRRRSFSPDYISDTEESGCGGVGGEVVPFESSILGSATPSPATHTKSCSPRPPSAIEELNALTRTVSGGVLVKHALVNNNSITTTTNIINNNNNDNDNDEESSSFNNAIKEAEAARAGAKEALYRAHKATTTPTTNAAAAAIPSNSNGGGMKVLLNNTTTTTIDRYRSPRYSRRPNNYNHIDNNNDNDDDDDNSNNAIPPRNPTQDDIDNTTPSLSPSSSSSTNNPIFFFTQSSSPHLAKYLFLTSLFLIACSLGLGAAGLGMLYSNNNKQNQQLVENGASSEGEGGLSKSNSVVGDGTSDNNVGLLVPLPSPMDVLDDIMVGDKRWDDDDDDQVVGDGTGPKARMSRIPTYSPTNSNSPSEEDELIIIPMDDSIVVLDGGATVSSLSSGSPTSSPSEDALLVVVDFMEPEELEDIEMDAVSTPTTTTTTTNATQESESTAMTTAATTTSTTTSQASETTTASTTTTTSGEEESTATTNTTQASETTTALTTTSTTTSATTTTTSVEEEEEEANLNTLQSLTIHPIADTWLEYNDPKAYGTKKRLKVDGHDPRSTLLKFNLKSLQSALSMELLPSEGGGIANDLLVGISLRLYSLTDSPFGGKVELLLEDDYCNGSSSEGRSSQWYEKNVSWTNAPSCVFTNNTQYLGQFGVIPAWEWNEAILNFGGTTEEDGSSSSSSIGDLPELVTLRITSHYADGVTYASKENVTAVPELVVYYTLPREVPLLDQAMIDDILEGDDNVVPTKSPTGSPTKEPTGSPTYMPSYSWPTWYPTLSPTINGTKSPTSSPSTTPEELALTVTQDAMLRGGSRSNYRFGRDPFIALRGNRRRALLQFDLSNNDAFHPQFEYAYTLRLFITYVGQNEQRSVFAHYITQDNYDWDENTITWDNFGSTETTMPTMDEIGWFSIYQSDSETSVDIPLGKLVLPSSGKLILVLAILNDGSDVNGGSVNDDKFDFRSKEFGAWAGPQAPQDTPPMLIATPEIG